MALKIAKLMRKAVTTAFTLAIKETDKKEKDAIAQLKKEQKIFTSVFAAMDAKAEKMIKNVYTAVLNSIVELPTYMRQNISVSNAVVSQKIAIILMNKFLV